jgi:hypothetical protein
MEQKSQNIPVYELQLKAWFDSADDRKALKELLEQHKLDNDYYGFTGIHSVEIEKVLKDGISDLRRQHTYLCRKNESTDPNKNDDKWGPLEYALMENGPNPSIIVYDIMKLIHELNDNPGTYSPKSTWRDAIVALIKIKSVPKED